MIGDDRRERPHSATSFSIAPNRPCQPFTVPAFACSCCGAQRGSDDCGIVAGSAVDKAIIKAPRVRESWFDPRYGALYEIHTTDNLAFQTYTPPTSGRGQDWVLVLEGVK